MSYISSELYNIRKNKLFFLNILHLRVILCVISGFLFACNCVSSFDMSNMFIIGTAIMILALSIFDVLIFYGNWCLTIIFSCIAYFNYSILVTNYIPVINDTLFTSLSEDPVSKVGINILLLFMLIVNLFLPKNIYKNNSKENNFINKENKNTILVFAIALILVLILIYGFGRPDVAGERGTPSQIYEYSLILFIIGFYFCGNKKLNIHILSIILALFSLQNFVYGGRVTGIQLIICWFLMIYSYKINVLNMLPWIIVLFILLSSIGIFRANFILSTDSLKNVFEELAKKKFALDTAYSAYYTSLTFIKVEDISTVTIRLGMFKNFILSMLLGGSIISNSSLAEYTREYYVHYNGGILPFFFHYYLGWLGVIVSAGIVSFYCCIINKIKYDSKGLIKCIGIFLTCHVFRWYLYSPSGLIRGVGLIVITYGIVAVFNMITQKKFLL